MKSKQFLRPQPLLSIIVAVAAVCFLILFGVIIGRQPVILDPGKYVPIIPETAWAIVEQSYPPYPGSSVTRQISYCSNDEVWRVSIHRGWVEQTIYYIDQNGMQIGADFRADFPTPPHEGWAPEDERNCVVQNYLYENNWEDVPEDY